MTDVFINYNKMIEFADLQYEILGKFVKLVNIDEDNNYFYYF